MFFLFFLRSRSFRSESGTKGEDRRIEKRESDEEKKKKKEITRSPPPSTSSPSYHQLTRLDPRSAPRREEKESFPVWKGLADARADTTHHPLPSSFPLSFSLCLQSEEEEEEEGRL